MKPAQKTQHASQAERGSRSDLGKVLREWADPDNPVNLPSFAVADLPAAGDYTGHIVFCSDGAAGSAILAFSDGTDWLRCDTAAAVAAA